MPQIVLHLILLSNHKKSKKERRITEIFLQRIPFSLKNYFCLGGVWLSLLGTNAQVLLSARSPSLILRCAPVWRALAMGQTSESLNLNGRCAFLSAALPSPSSLRDATSPKVRGFGYTGKFAFLKKLSLWESWREAPERARTLPARLRVSFNQTYDKSQCRPLRRGGAASDWESYHLNPHFLKYRIRFPVCQRAGFRLRWAARCHAWMAVYWGTR